MTILSIPFDCSNLSTFLGEVSCSEFPMVLFKVSSIITLIVFVPFALLTSLVYFDDNPNSSLPTAKPIGRLDFYDTMMRSVLTLAVVLLRKEAVLLSLLTFLMLLFLASFLNVTLPFFKMWMNRMRSIMYLILLWLSLGTVIVSIGKISGSSLRTFSIAWMAVAILPGLTGMQLPRIRYRWLFKLSWKIGNQLKYDEEMMRLGITDAAAQAFSPHELYEKRRKFRGSKYRLSNTTMTDLLSPPSRSKIHKEDRINQWASSDRSRTVDRLGGDDAGKEQKDEDVSKSVNAHSDIMSSDSQNDRYPLAEIVKRYFILEYDIELMVRALLENPTRENFKQATVVLNAALTSFPESVFVRIVYAYLILTYSNNSTRAVKLLKEAQRLEAPLDLRFLLFSKIHAWNQIRQHESMGTGKDMVSAIQFKKKINEARENHVLTIRKITKFWELLRSEDETDRGSIATVLEEIYEAREKARATYCELLGEYPSNKHVAYSYGLFCLFVLNDESKAEAYLNKSRIDQDEETRHPVEGSIVGSKHPSTVAGGGGAPQFQWRVKCEEFHTLHRIKVWFRTSVVLLFLLTLGTFITSIVLLKNFENTNKSIYYSGKARMSIQDTWCFSRNMHLGAAAKKEPFFLMGQRTLEDAEKLLAGAHKDMYLHGYRNSAITSLWTDSVLPLEFYDPNEGSRAERRGLWDAGNLFTAAVATMSDFGMDQMSQPKDEPLWRLVADNTYSVLLEAYETMADMYDSASRQTSRLSILIQAVLFGTKGLGIIMAAFLVFRPGIRAIADARVGLHSIVERIPLRVIKFFRKKYKAISRIYDKIEQSEEGEASMFEQQLESSELRDNSKLFCRNKKNENGVQKVPQTRPSPKTPRALEATTSSRAKNSNLNVPAKGKVDESISPKAQRKTADELLREDQTSLNILLEHSSDLEETHEILESDVGMDAEHDAELVAAAQETTLTLQGKQEASLKCVKEVDGIVREEKYPHVFVPKLCDENLRAHNQLYGQIRRSNVESSQGDAVNTTMGLQEENGSDTPDGAATERAYRNSEEDSARTKSSKTGPSADVRLEDTNGDSKENSHTVDTSTKPANTVPSAQIAVQNEQWNSKEGSNAGWKPPNAFQADTKQVRERDKATVGKQADRVFLQGVEDTTAGNNRGYYEEANQQSSSESSSSAMEQPYRTDGYTSNVFLGKAPNKPAKGSELNAHSKDLSPKTSPTRSSISGKLSSRLLSHNMNLLLLLLSGRSASSDEKRIRNLVFQLVIAVVVLIGLFSSSFVMRANFMKQASTTASIINYGKRRVHLSTEVTILTRELLINDGELFQSFNATKRRLEKRLSYLRVIHNGLRFGNNTLNLPGGDVTTSPQGLESDGEENGTNDPYEDSFFPRGIDVGIEFLEYSAKLILDQYEPSMGLPGPNLTRLEQIQRLNLMVTLDRGFIRPQLVESSKKLFAKSSKSLQSVHTMEVLLFLCDVSLYVLLYATIYRTIYKQLQSEGRRKEDMLSLIPQTVIEHIRPLHVFFEQGDNSKRSRL
eukprot:gb/GECG01000284.1/.p1 GENE.gb/GECG01000284.1/~~gb/GECG01000284.1/.p1  ORF type:complete len:1524 (+),score=208.60 gb/GECG01000284.1/:1-4572(+)